MLCGDHVGGHRTGCKCTNGEPAAGASIICCQHPSDMQRICSQATGLVSSGAPVVEYMCPLQVQFSIATTEDVHQLSHLKAALSDRLKPTQDPNGFRKLVVALTAAGKQVCAEPVGSVHSCGQCLDGDHMQCLDMAWIQRVCCAIIIHGIPAVPLQMIHGVCP